MNATLFGLPLILTTACKKSGLSSAELPSPEQVFQRYEQALEGSDVELQNLYMVATIDVPLTGMSGTLDTWIIKDEGMMLQMDVGDIGTTYQGTDLNHVWAIDPMSGPKLLEGEERIAQLDQYNSMFTDMIHQYQDSSLVQKGIKKINGQKTYKIEGIKSSTNKKHTMFFAVDSGLLIAEYGMVNMQGGSMKSKSFFTEYMNTEHGLMPKKIEQKMMGISVHLTFEDYQVNVENSPNIEIPAEVLALIEEESGRSPTPNPSGPEAAPKKPLEPMEVE